MKITFKIISILGIILTIIGFGYMFSISEQDMSLFSSYRQSQWNGVNISRYMMYIGSAMLFIGGLFGPMIHKKFQSKE